MTLLAGVNGIGKTSVIEALLGAVTELWSRLAPDGRSLVQAIRRSGSVLREGSIDLDLTVGDGVPAACSVAGHRTRLPIDQVLSEVDVSPIPLVVYYDQNRIGGLSSRTLRSSRGSNREAALDTTPDTLSDFKDWYFEKESDEAREAVARNDLEYADPEVQAVRGPSAHRFRRPQVQEARR